MNPFAFDPAQIAEEISSFSSKLSAGVNSLAGLQDIDVGASARECVYSEDKLQLFRYLPRCEQTLTTPLLIVYALVNRPYMADLQEGRSLVQGLLDAGIDVYLIDWGYPDSADRDTSLDDYINTYLDHCVDFICSEHKLEKINLLGICQGGTFSLCYTALHQEKVANLVTTVTPVDFHTKNDLLSMLVREIDIDLCVDTLGNVPGEFLNWVFLSLKPYRLLGQKYVELVDILDDEDRALNFMRMEKWIFDSPDQAGEAFRQFVMEFYQQNWLVKGSVKIGGQVVDLQNITVPILNIYARDDHLVPTDASKALAGCVSSEDYSEIEFPGGHIGIYVSSRAQSLLPAAIGEWLEERCQALRGRLPGLFPGEVELNKPAPVLFIPHGGGPLPLLGDPAHRSLTRFLEDLPGRFKEPAAILLISAHWEEDVPTLTAAGNPEIIYDYYGFPERAYTITYPASGDQALASRCRVLLKQAGIDAKLDSHRGFDHGLFVPLKLIYPDAHIPCVQLSLASKLDPAFHINLGRAISELRLDNVLIMGSGLSFHNMGVFFSPTTASLQHSIEFDQWLVETCSSEKLDAGQRKQRLLDWEKAPSARFSHPREEHLLPLHVCFGAAMHSSAAQLVFNEEVLGHRVTGLLWRD